MSADRTATKNKYNILSYIDNARLKSESVDCQLMQWVHLLIGLKHHLD